jgi:hypothetical protein
MNTLFESTNNILTIVIVIEYAWKLIKWLRARDEKREE